MVTRAARCAVPLLVVLLMCAGRVVAADRNFSFERYLFDDPPTLFAFVAEINPATGHVLVNGGDSQQPSMPFTWRWGDGAAESGWFPSSHVYDDPSANYVCTVTAHYNGGATDSTRVVIRFVPPDVDPVPLPDGTTVSVPDTLVELTSRMPGYGIPSGLVPFGDEFFPTIPRTLVEYVLWIAATMQRDMVNGDVFLVEGGFRQFVLRDPSFGGMYSLWYTSPVSFAAGDYAFQGTVEWSSFFHEMGHNVTLNFPADHYYGGKVDGSANAIYSETMAQIFQHATAYDVVNTGAEYGLSPDVVADIEASAVQSIVVVRNAYEDYVSGGMDFSSWNDPQTPEDETFNTFMTLAYAFCAHAETGGLGYRLPAKRMAWLLSVFDPYLESLYDRGNDTAEADTFRSTLMVTALSFAFESDLRDEFRGLNFPVSDATYDGLLGMITGVEDGTGHSPVGPALVACSPNPFSCGVRVVYRVPERGRVLLRVCDVSGREVRTLVDREECPGGREAVWDGRDGHGRAVAAGVYLLDLRTEGGATRTKAVVLR